VHAVLALLAEELRAQDRKETPGIAG